MSALGEWQSWVDGHINVKGVYRRLQLTARFLVVGTFADDSIRVTFDYSGQVSTMQSVGFGLPLASILPAVFIMTQGISVFLIISEIAPEPGCVALLVWTGLHPFIYKQESTRAGLGAGLGPGLGLGLGPGLGPGLGSGLGSGLGPGLGPGLEPGLEALELRSSGPAPAAAGPPRGVCGGSLQR